MTAVLSKSSSPTPSPHPQSPPATNQSQRQAMMANPQKRSILQRPSSYARERLSTYSSTSNKSQKPSRPPSHVFLQFHSSLSYTQVRDFSYPTSHPFHYGPPADSSAAASGQSTPAYIDDQRFSNPPSGWDPSNDVGAASWPAEGGTEQLPQMAYGDPRDDHGPPYSEDEDLQSPVVMSSRHKKPSTGRTNSSSSKRPSPRGQARSTEKASEHGNDRGVYAGTNGDGSETYYVGQEDEMADGPGGELVTYPPDQARYSSAMLFPHTYHSPRQASTGDPSDAGPARTSQYSDSNLEPGSFNTDESRFSRDYQFTIASADEEMHGKAVALFDFARENENELPLVEGQVIWVSYRHGQGWLVAEDPKTRESGLVPEEYVRLLRDIEGGWTSLEGGQMSATDAASPKSPRHEIGSAVSAGTIAQPADTGHGNPVLGSVASNGEKHPPIVSTFSTSSKDLDKYPHPLLGTQTGQAPPQVVHYGSQANTPTVMSPVHSTSAEKSKKSSEEGELRRTASGREIEGV